MNSGYMKKKVPRGADGRIDFKPKKHHGFSFFIMLCGFLLPPLAVAVRFGIGKDFFINVILTICGYFPGHGHNFFLQNIRNNEHRGRTPKWAKRYGLVDDSDAKHLAKKRAWAGRYNEQGASRQMYDDDGNVYEYDYNHKFEDGDGPSRPRQRPDHSEEHFFGQDRRANGHDASSSSRTSLSSTRRRNDASSGDLSSGYGDGVAPGAGEAERRRAKNKSLSRGFLSRGKGKDRHARAEQVMGDGIGSNYRSPYDDPSNDSLDGIGGSGGRSNGRARPPSGYSDDFEGPENVDDNVGRRYAARANTSKASSAQALRQPQRDIMDDNHQF